MANYNRVILVGNLTRDPQLSYLPNQTPVCELGLAVNRRWKGQDGQQREDTCFIDCRAYGKPGEIISQYMSKGRPILVEGRLQFDQWEGKDGQRRSKHRVIVENFQFLGGGGGGGGRSQGGGGRPAPQQQQQQRQGPPPGEESQEPPPNAYEGGGDDIPF